MIHSALTALCATEYGISPTCRGARGFLAAVAGPRRLHSAGAYVASCRRLQAQGRADDGLAPLSGEGRIDGRLEIMGNDLVRGVRTPVVLAFAHAAERAGASWYEAHREDHRLLASPAPWRGGARVRQLLTHAALVAEGEAQGHCVGSYGGAVERGECHILSINVRGCMSTVELARDGRVLQHRGGNNNEPHPLCVLVLRRFLERNRLVREEDRVRRCGLSLVPAPIVARENEYVGASRGFRRIWRSTMAAIHCSRIARRAQRAMCDYCGRSPAWPVETTVEEDGQVIDRSVIDLCAECENADGDGA